MAVIKKREKAEPKITRSYRLRADLVRKIEKIAQELGESRTYVLESLLDYAIKCHETEQKKSKKNWRSQAKNGRNEMEAK